MNREDLLTIARHLVETGGLEALTMDRLAEAAGISRSSAYRLIGSREALVDELAAAGAPVGVRGDLRARVLAAAREVFSRQGFDAATIEAIAEAAEVGTATVYRHFGDKKGLVDAALADLAPRRAVWAAAREPSGDLAADLQRVAQTVLQTVADNPTFFRIMVLERIRGSSLLGELAASPERTIHALVALLRHYIARGEVADDDPYRLAQAFQGLLLGFGMLPAIWDTPREPDPERDAKLVVGIFLRGVARGAP